MLEYIEWMEGYNWSIATTTRRQCNFSLNKIKISFPRLSRVISFGVEPIYLAPENRMPLLSEQRGKSLLHNDIFCHGHYDYVMTWLMLRNTVLIWFPVGCRMHGILPELTRCTTSFLINALKDS
jgi:hypothetical protein